MRVFRIGRFLADVAILVMITFLLSHLGGCKAVQVREAGYRAALITRDAGDKTSQILGTIAELQHKECLAKCPGMPCPAYIACIGKYKKALEIWHNYTKPALNTALAATYGALETARKAKKGVDWMTLLKPGLCALIEGLAQWKHLLGPKAAQILGSLEAIAKGVCR